MAIDVGPLGLVGRTTCCYVYMYMYALLFQSQIRASEEAATAQVKCQELQYQGVALCHLLVEEKEAWLIDKTAIIDCLKKMWMSEAFHAKFTTVRSVHQ